MKAFIRVFHDLDRPPALHPARGCAGTRRRRSIGAEFADGLGRSPLRTETDCNMDLALLEERLAVPRNRQDDVNRAAARNRDGRGRRWQDRWTGGYVLGPRGWVVYCSYKWSEVVGHPKDPASGSEARCGGIFFYQRSALVSGNGSQQGRDARSWHLGEFCLALKYTSKSSLDRCRSRCKIQTENGSGNKHT